MSDLIGVMSGLWADVGPGLLLAAALPILLLALGAIVMESWRRFGGASSGRVATRRSVPGAP